MKKFILPFLALMTAACIFPTTKSLRSVMDTYDDFTLERIIKQSDAEGADRLLSGDVSLFVEFSMDSCLVAEFKHGAETYTVEIVAFPDQKSALGAYSIRDLPDSQPVKLGIQARRNDKAIQVVKGFYIVSVIPRPSGNMSGAVELAEGLVKRIPKGVFKSDIYGVLPQDRLVENSQLYFKGPKAFSERFPSKLAVALNIDKALEGFAGRYDIDGQVVDFLKIRFLGRESTLEATNSYLKTRSDRPILIPRETLPYYTVIESDRSEVYIAEYGEWLLMLTGNSPGEKAKPFFEYILRGGK